MTELMQNAPNVAIVAYDGVQQSAVFGLADMFDVANRMVSGDGRARVLHQIVNSADVSNEMLLDAFILPPNLTGQRGCDDHGLHHWIGAMHKAGAIACSACAGCFWLGQADILDGRRVTTHWALEGEFRLAFPEVDLVPERTLIDGNDIVTAGGVMAWVDLGVHLIGRWCGPTVVDQVCRQMLIDPSPRDQRNYRSFRPKFSIHSLV